MNIAQTIDHLLTTLRKANEAYRQGSAIMTDASYDQLEAELRDMLKMVPSDSTDPNVPEARKFLAGIGLTPVNGSPFAKVTHTMQMTSLNKATNLDELQDWFAEVSTSQVGLGITYVVSEKLDGISVNCSVEDGNLILAATRGDGFTGEDITRNVRKMQGVPQFIKGFTGQLRGEIILTHADWQKYFPEYTNPRNAASGIAKRLDGAGSEHLTVMFYQMVRSGLDASGNPVTQIPRKELEFQVLEKIGVPVAGWALCHNYAEILAVYQEYLDGKRASAGYELDGLVVEISSAVLADNLGMTNQRPKGSCALKFPADAKETTLLDIIVQVGKSGRETPVAVFDPVQLCGATVSRATLHNFGQMARIAAAGGQKFLSVGDRIIVSRRGDVIPAVESLVLSAQLSASVRLFTPPTHCPACNFPLVMEGEYLLCKNGADCPEQLVGAIARWVTKIGVLGMGDSLIESLVDHAGVTDAADLYTLDAKKIESIPTGSNGSRLGQTAYTIVTELHSKKQMPLHTMIGSLGIPLCSRSVCKTISEAGFDTLEKMQAAKLSELAAIPGMGATKAQAFITGLKSKQTLIDKLIDNGIQVIAPVTTGGMAGQSVCFTGVRDPSLEKAIEAAGGQIKSSVGRGLGFLVAKDPNAGSGKLIDAKSKGVKVVSVADMWALVNASTGGSVVAVATPAGQTGSAPTVPMGQPTGTAPAILTLNDLFGD